MNKIHQIVKDRILNAMDNGIVPWVKPWRGGQGHSNMKTGIPYSGINTALCACSGFVSPYWLTFKQCKAMGGVIGKGEQSSIIVFYSKKDKPVQDWKDEEVPECYWVLRYYNVFNLEQISGIEPPKYNDNTEIVSADKLVTNWTDAPEIKTGSYRACYCLTSDIVEMPLITSFENSDKYYLALYHELIHSTLNEKRLNRNNKNYAKEELIAEKAANYITGNNAKKDDKKAA